MKLLDFFVLLHQRKKLWAISTGISLVVLLLITLLFRLFSYELTATLRLENSILFSAAAQQPTQSGYTALIPFPLTSLDDKTAIAYVQNNKSYFGNTGMLDYQTVVNRISDSGFMGATINSATFKSYLHTEGILSPTTTISLVEQTNSLALRLSGSSPDILTRDYQALPGAIAAYLAAAQRDKLQAATDGLLLSIQTDTAAADSVMAEYTALRAKTGFTGIADYNKGVTLLNQLSALAHSTSVNSDTKNRLYSLLQSNFTPDVLEKNLDKSGLTPAKAMVPFLLMELVAAILLGFLCVFLSTLMKTVRAASDR